MLDFQRVSFWLDTLSDTLPDLRPHDSPPRPHFKAPSTKRKAVQEPSPPVSLGTSTDMDQDTPKRWRKSDPNHAPRPTHGGTIPSSASSTLSSLAPSENSDALSRASSLKKQMMNLRLDDGGLDAPAPATDLLATIREIGNGLEILPRSHKAVILESPRVKDQNMRIWRYAFKEQDVPDSLPGLIPTPDKMALVCELACHRHDKSHEEASWNMEVHHGLLQAVFRRPGSSKGDLLNFATCTTARPHSKYLPYSSPTKMVDFCLYLDNPNDTNALQALGPRTPILTVNHTDFVPLQLSPTALSIETKRPGKELDAAQLQIGVWHAVQWKFLRFVVGLTGQSMSAAEEVSRRRVVDEALAELGFIPGVIVQGIAGCLSVRRSRSILDAYHIVAGLRELAGWIRDVYLPWFRSKVLSGFSDENET
ncbi:hypothetical protein QQZ08_005402 [Neonectria magnoliae]|uniref:PD-(D/E)XK nuclease-like domain-containing protein n=1 Tax=Neonectria magnoliae TaxID=2732573 RepID=A0ABR1I5J7_9HYPO